MLNSRTWAVAMTLCLALGSNAVAQQKGNVKPLTTQDYIDIQQLLHKYAFAIDGCTNNGYDYADLYTPDGIFYWGQNSPRKSVGREQLAEAGGGGKNGCKKLQVATKEKPLQASSLAGGRISDRASPVYDSVRDRASTVPGRAPRPICRRT